jgi:hypothetical protein
MNIQRMMCTIEIALYDSRVHCPFVYLQMKIGLGLTSLFRTPALHKSCFPELSSIQLTG